MSAFTPEKQNRLSCLLKEEKGHFEKIRELTEEQSQLLTCGDIGAFDKSLDARQEIIDKIERLHQETDVLMQSYVSVSAALKKNVPAIDKLREEIRAVISDVAKKNEKNIGAAKSMAEQYSTQSNKLNMSRKSLGLYSQGVVYSGDNFDSKT